MVKQFFKTVDVEENYFNYTWKNFPILSKENFGSGIFDSLQIRQLMKDIDFIKVMPVPEAESWKRFVFIV